MSNEQTIWTMDSDYCDKCGAYLFEDDMSGLCSFCFNQMLSEEEEDDFYFDGDDDLEGFDDTGNRHNEMWESPIEDIPTLDSNALRWARHREHSFPDTDSISRTEPWKWGELPHE